MIFRDITIYLEEKLLEPSKRRGGEFDENWPGKEKQREFRSIPGGLFIHISTVLKYLYLSLLLIW